MDVCGNSILKLVICRGESLPDTAKPDHTTHRDLQQTERVQSEMFPVFPNVILDFWAIKDMKQRDTKRQKNPFTHLHYKHCCRCSCCDPLSEYVRLFSTGETGRETDIVKSRWKENEQTKTLNNIVTFRVQQCSTMYICLNKNVGWTVW